MSPDERTVVDKFKIAQAVADQIAVEQNLRANRMNWNLTFQGFMMAAFALVAAEKMNQARISLEVLICFAGAAVAYATWQGIEAAQRQSTALKKYWNDLNLSESMFPVPFSVGIGEEQGRAPTFYICMTTIFMWVVLLLIIIVMPQTFEDTEVDRQPCVGVCTIKS